MYDFLENEDVYWENTTHATDLFGERAVQIIQRQVRQVFFFFFADKLTIRSNHPKTGQTSLDKIQDSRHKVDSFADLG
jgi:hypothetical protein